MSIMIGRARVRRFTARIFEQPTARILMRLKVRPIAVTFLGLMLAGVAAYLVKPVSLTRLLDTVEEAISGKA